MVVVNVCVCVRCLLPGEAIKFSLYDFGAGDCRCRRRHLRAAHQLEEEIIV